MAQDPTPILSKSSHSALASIPIAKAHSPSYIIHLEQLEKNCQSLKSIAERSGAKVLLALKGYACYSTFSIINQYLNGTTSSGLHEAMLAKEFFGKEVHVYSPAYNTEEIKKLSKFAHSLVFNSARQLSNGLEALKGNRRPELGLRVNPEYSELGIDLYDSCAPSSRLGTTREALDKSLNDLSCDLLKNLDGLHFHTLCEQDADTLERTVDVFESKFSDLIPQMKWINFGGGHHITRAEYDVERLIRVIKRFREKYGVSVYLEPGEAVALHTGMLVVTILDIVESGAIKTAILDCSVTCHMPDVLEMPYRPGVLGAGLPGEYVHNYRLGGISCLAGDIAGDYSFPEALEVGQRLAFLDMSHYTMVKNTTFNGVPLPAISLYSESKGLDTIRRFGYEDYRSRLS